jgi:dTDP-4-dehydrorhamnose reductase
MDQSSILIIGANGQLGIALQNKYPNAIAVDADKLDITNFTEAANFNWDGIKIILNAAAYTNVDGAETTEGRTICWQVNAVGAANLARISSIKKLTLIHISSDYVFDGTQVKHTEIEAFSPLGVYGQSKAAGDIAVTLTPKHYILRTSWVIGEGGNFVRTMVELGKRGVSPSVVNDQIGRLTFASELVVAIDYTLSNMPEFGIYNVSNEGQVVSWADITKEIFNIAKFDLKVTGISTKDYYKDKTGIAPRPLNSNLDLSKIEAIGFSPKNWKDDLIEYVSKELNR